MAEDNFAKLMGWHSEATAKCFSAAIRQAGIAKVRVAMMSENYSPALMESIAVDEMRRSALCASHGVTLAEVVASYRASVAWAESPEGAAVIAMLNEKTEN